MANALQDLSKDLADLVAGAAPSVLQVDARRRIPASGIAWSEHLIVTANHVVESDDDISVGLPDGERARAELIGRDPRRDLALLRVDTALTPADWAGAAGLRVGEIVLGLGRPRQDLGAALGLVAGIISGDEMRRRWRRRRAMWEKRGPQFANRKRRERWQKRIMEGGGHALAGGLIRVDLTMYPGFSGGPLIGADGKAHGMTTSGFGGGFGLAIPVAALSSSVAALQKHGKITSGYLGVGVQAALLPEAIADSQGQASGLLIVSVEAGSPAAAAGLMVGDILTTLGDTALEDIDDLLSVLASAHAGDQLLIGFARGGEARRGSVTIGAN